MTFFILYDSEDSEFGIVTSTCLFSGWVSSLIYLSNDPSSWKNESSYFGQTTPELWVTTQSSFQYLGSFSAIPTLITHPELFV